MAKDDKPRVPNGPTVPDGPTVTTAANGSTEKPGDRDPIVPPWDPAADALNRSDERRTGGRRPYEEILEENKQLARQVAAMREALRPFMRIPVDRTKKPGDPQYSLTKGVNTPFVVTGAMVDAAVAAVQG